MKIQVDSAPPVSGSRYPSPNDTPCLDRVRKRLGDAAGAASGHHLQNRSGADALVLEVGSRRDDDEAHYPDIDLHALKGRSGYAHKDGRPYPGAKPLDPATGK